MVLSSQVPRSYIVGLRDSHSLEDHLASLGNDIDVEQRIPQINGYAISISETNNDVLSRIRQDSRVGFVVEKLRGFFSQDGHLGLETDDLTDYLEQRMWLTLQDQDPEVPVTDDDSALIPLTWRVHFVDGNAMDRQISKIGNDITIFDVLSYISDAIIDELYAARIVHSHLNATTRTTFHYGPSRAIMAAGIEAVETQGLAKIDEVTHIRVLVDLLSLDKIAVSRTLCISITMIVAILSITNDRIINA
ncbi:hypothetical protein D6D28_09758 [Aureobasidium pullulans]|uniref:Uncharacterized protein n=1 Tax=Aureobasidium pullulans TaxID=5580 RepID=A0A4S8S3R9_AURPU|nr:hypothetical protein D6D28_09758 [Aureobasidium pullulans]